MRFNNWMLVTDLVLENLMNYIHIDLIFNNFQSSNLHVSSYSDNNLKYSLGQNMK